VRIATDGFSLGSIGTNPSGLAFDDTWIVHAQVPTPGELHLPGTAIRLTLQDPTLACP
jgi:hypothetical protein